ncbi:Bacteriophage lysis protein [compost metagenome]
MALAEHLKCLGVLALLLLTAVGVWKVQDWRYGKQLADQSGAHQADLTAISNTTAAQVRADQDKRLALEQRLSASEQSHYKELSDAQTSQARLRDRLATADLRLSVLLDATDSAGGCSVPATTSTGGVVHGGARARLDPAHAQRIVAITDEGDRGLIALKACQAYAREVTLRQDSAMIMHNQKLLHVNIE